MTSRIANIAINAVQPRRVADFWCEVLGWHVIEEGADLISIGSADGSLPGIDVLQVPGPKAGYNRLHLALTPSGGHLVREDVHHGKSTSGVHS